MLLKTLLLHCVITLPGNLMRTFGECSVVFLTDVVHNILGNVRRTFKGYFIKIKINLQNDFVNKNIILMFLGC